MKISVCLASLTFGLAVPACAVNLGTERESIYFLDATSYESYQASLNAAVANGWMTEQEATQLMGQWLQQHLAAQLKQTSN
jgi:hypothetical protein